ncbi:MAG: prolyl aminopeptidase [Gammaproteobacteria bacterium]|nr:MAG: prolyl aminopeptidase [Gammaproteobacteria bacterium]
MRTLFPSLKPLNEYFLQVGHEHCLRLEESGTVRGIPVLFLHGGPGAGCEASHRRFFDPEHYRIILFDQRGAGHSTPHASLEANTIQDLIADIEAIRAYLHIEKWVVFGGSWGSTLALAYAQAYPQQVLGLILRGIFLCRPREIHWFYQDGANRVFPDHWQHFIAPIPENERDDLVNAHYRKLTGDDEIARMASAKAWSVWEGRTSNLLPNQAVADFFTNPHTALSLARIEAHYFVNNSFLEPDQLLCNARKLKDIPGTIVQGRYDMVCPMESAWALHKAWRNSTLQVIPDAGHSAFEPGITHALIHATDGMAHMLKESR